MKDMLVNREALPRDQDPHDRHGALQRASATTPPRSLQKAQAVPAAKLEGPGPQTIRLFPGDSSERDSRKAHDHGVKAVGSRAGGARGERTGPPLPTGQSLAVPTRASVLAPTIVTHTLKAAPQPGVSPEHQRGRHPLQKAVPGCAPPLGQQRQTCPCTTGKIYYCNIINTMYMISRHVFCVTC